MEHRKPEAQKQFETIMQQLRKKEYSNIYLLMGTKDGTESYYMDCISQFVIENVLAPEEKDFNLSIFYGADSSMKKVIEQAKRFPMMAEQQVVVLREAQAVKDFDLIEKYVERPNPSTVLVICYKGAVDGRKKYLSQINKDYVVGAFAPLRDWEMEPFVEQEIRQRGGSADAKSVSMIVQHVGNDMKRIVSEIDKLMVSFPEGTPKNITAEVVEKCIGISKDFNIFELRDAIGQHNIEKTNLIVKHLMGNPRSGGLYALIPMLFSFFQDLMIAFYAPGQRTPASVMNHLGLRSEFAAKKYLEAMKHYNALKTLQIIDKFREIDAKSKGLDATGNTTPEELAKELIFFILH